MMFEYFQNSGKRRLSFVTPNRDLCFKTRVGALEYLKFLDLVPRKETHGNKKDIDLHKNITEENKSNIVFEKDKEGRKTKHGKENVGEDFLGQLTKKVVEMKKKYDIQELKDDNKI